MYSHKEGFTTVELLVTLFVAVAFITTGHQLYTSVIRDGAQMRQRAAASNLAHDYLRRRADEISSCPSSPSNNTTNITNSDLPNAQIETTISAPYGCSGTGYIALVKVRIIYGPYQQRKEVTHGTYVQK